MKWIYVCYLEYESHDMDSKIELAIASTLPLVYELKSMTYSNNIKYITFIIMKLIQSQFLESKKAKPNWAYHLKQQQVPEMKSNQ